ncbi:MAG: alpha-1,2-fucosyltransferase [Actinomycetota bacterium]|nr:alpha-1,2-fucosyltransferase [Actinomycetota bacterium]
MNELADPTRLGITANLVGGLGNQLFQYAAARGAAGRLECPMFVDVATLARLNPNDTLREFALGWLLDPAQVVDSGTAAESGRWSAALRRRLPGISVGRTFQQQGFAYDPRFEKLHRGAILSGYFQSWRYSANVQDQLRQDILNRIPHSAWFDETTDLLNSLGPWIAVHVRRGDYLQARNSAYHGLLGLSYYARALARLRNSGEPVVIFSDEPEAARAFLGPLAAQALVVDSPPQAHEAESIELMSQASAVVTANSSFSWWGAWLADPATTTVVCPTPWLDQAGLDEHDLRPPQWITIDSSFGQQ